MIETTSGGSFNHDQMKPIQNDGWMRSWEEASGQKTPHWGYYEANFLFEIWADEESDGKKAQYIGKHRRKAQ